MLELSARKNIINLCETSSWFILILDFILKGVSLTYILYTKNFNEIYCLSKEFFLLTLWNCSTALSLVGKTISEKKKKDLHDRNLAR